MRGKEHDKWKRHINRECWWEGLIKWADSNKEYAKWWDKETSKKYYAEISFKNRV